MILPADVDIEKDSVEKIQVALMKVGYGKDAARYVAGKLKGEIVDDNVLQ